MKYLLLIWWLAQASLLLGQTSPIYPANGVGPTPQVVKDMFAGFDAAGSDPALFTANDHAVFFTAKNSAHGRELWKTQGGNGDAVMVADLTPGRGDSKITRLFGMGTLMFFVKEDGLHGREMWRSDGTAAGTFLLRDIFPGSGSGFWNQTQEKGDAVAFGGQLYFMANDGVTGFELWRSDGTPAGTVLFKDINAVPNAAEVDSFPFQMTVVGANLYFVATVSGQGAELWKSNGTAAGTQMVKEINPGEEGAVIRQLTAVGSGVYFSAYTPATGYELWKSDGSSAGTQLVKDMNPGTGSSFDNGNLFVALGSVLLFTAKDTTEEASLWRSDGTAAGTQRVMDLVANGATNGYFSEMVSNGTQAWFIAADNIHGEEVWRTDGTPAGTARVADLLPGAEGSADSLTLAGGTVLFSAASATDFGLWKISPVDGSPQLVRGNLRIENTGNGQPFATLNTTVYFSAEDYEASLMTPSSGEEIAPSLYGTEPWKSNFFGTTELVKDIVTSNRAGPPRELAAMGNVVFYAAYDEDHGVELWRSEGTLVSTRLVKDIRPGVEHSHLKGLTVSGNLLFFLADDGSTGLELWRSDGTEGGTYLVKDIRPGAAGRPMDPETLVATSPGKIHFAADDGVHGREMWRSDGSSFGTEMVADVLAGSAGSNPASIALLRAGGLGNETLVFAAEVGVAGYELWITDGTPVGTHLLKDINPGVGNSFPYSLTASAAGLFNNLIYFVADDGVHGTELWRTDGTEFGTQLVADISAGGASSYPREITPLGNGSNTVLFRANNNVNGEELWKGDASSASMVKDVYPGYYGSEPSEIKALNGLVYFLAADPEGFTGPELWKSDGTAGGTTKIWANPFPYGSAWTQDLQVAGQKLIFRTGLAGLLWQSDGTSAGTEVLANLDGDDAGIEIQQMVATTDAAFLLAKFRQNETDLCAVPILPMWDGWRKQHFGITSAVGNAADVADPDSDGVVNLLERAFGLDPNLPDAPRLPQPEWITGGSFTGYQMQYHLEPGAPGLEYTMEKSATLLPGSWQSADDVGQPLYRLYRLPRGPGWEFMRWKITVQ